MKRKIFVVEKDADIHDIIVRILSEEGYEVNSSRSEFGIFEQIKNAMPDIILLDVVSASAQGTELCRAIKSANEIKHIPVVVLSTHLKVDATKSVHADEITPKPFDVNKLADIIESQLLNNSP